MSISNRSTFSLDVLQIKSPCTENWDAMTDNGQTRYCAKCELHVHDLTTMPPAQVQQLLANSTGRLCVRMPAPASAPGATTPAPPAPMHWRERLRRAIHANDAPLWQRLVASLGFLSVSLWSLLLAGCGSELATNKPVTNAGNNPPPPINAGIMGKMAVPPPAPPTTPLIGDVAMPVTPPRAQVMGRMVAPAPPLVGEIYVTSRNSDTPETPEPPETPDAPATPAPVAAE